MRLIEPLQLSAAQKEQLRQLWNREFPQQLELRNTEAFNEYLKGLWHLKHQLLLDPNEMIVAWLFLFQREGEQWFGLIIDSSMQGKGHGARMMDLAKSENSSLNGWVVDHPKYTKTDGLPYRAPLAFYTRLGFNIVPDARIQNDQMDAVQITWKQA